MSFLRLRFRFWLRLGFWLSYWLFCLRLNYWLCFRGFWFTTLNLWLRYRFWFGGWWRCDF